MPNQPNENTINRSIHVPIGLWNSLKSFAYPNYTSISRLIRNILLASDWTNEENDHIILSVPKEQTEAVMAAINEALKNQ